MTSKNKEKWLVKYSALREHVEAHGHLTDRHTQLNHWWKYQKKKRKEGKLTEEQERLLDELELYRSREHTGGRRKKETLPVPPTSLRQGSGQAVSSAQRLKGGE